MSMHITVNNDLGSRGNTFPAEVEFSDKNQTLPPCLFQRVSFSSGDDSFHSNLLLGDLTNNTRKKRTDHLRIYSVILM